jgi:two-component system response regulator AtoC
MAERVLIVDDEPNLREMLQAILAREGYDTEGAAGGEEALSRLREHPADIVVTDLRMPGMDGLALLSALRAEGILATVVVMTAYGSTATALEAMKAGAYDYISKPFKPEEIVLTLRKAQERERLRRENLKLRRELGRQFSREGIVFQSQAMAEVLRSVEKVAPYKSTVLVTGESGTGKEVIARAIHHSGPRGSQAFVAVNCGAIPSTLLESELFGHVKGAFTDAVRDRRGLFQEADAGTLFLDEIGELPLPLQVKLLRVLQEGVIRRVGDTREMAVDVRIIAATARVLATEVQRGRFREDLYYRLNVMHLAIPPLRERREDISVLAAHFLQKANDRLGTQVERIAAEAMECLRSYDWPGNVRELENVVERAVVLSEGEVIGIDELPERFRPAPAQPGEQPPVPPDDLSLKRAVRALEVSFIRRALQRTGGNRTRAAEILELSPRALLYKLKEYGIR